MTKFNKIFLYFVLFIISLCNVNAQREAENWYFGNKAGLNFSLGTPRALLNGQMMAGMTSAVWSDPQTGALLFYTNGVTVWNKNHQMMQNGNDLLGNINVYQNCLIIPKPKDKNKFYLFTLGTSDIARPDSLPLAGGIFPVFCRLYYSMIDMKGDNGFGKIDGQHKNVFISDTLNHKLTVVPHHNKEDYWLIVHEGGNNCFKVYLVNEDGISFSKRQCIGSNHWPIGDNDYTLTQSAGFMKASPNGKLLSVSVPSFIERPLEIFRFNNVSGEIFDFLSIGSFAMQFGQSFSPDNSKLYLFSRHELEYNEHEVQLSLFQFDVSDFNKDHIESSMYIYTSNDRTAISIGSLQLAPDGKVYLVSGPMTSVRVLNFPNRPGDSADLREVFLDFGENRSHHHGLPNFPSYYFDGLDSSEIGEKETCISEETIQVYPNPTSDFLNIDIYECNEPFYLRGYNSIGQLIFDQYFDNNSDSYEVLNLKTVASGLYIFEFNFNNIRINKKIIKK